MEMVAYLKVSSPAIWLSGERELVRGCPHAVDLAAQLEGQDYAGNVAVGRTLRVEDHELRARFGVVARNAHQVPIALARALARNEGHFLQPVRRAREILLQL